MLRHLVNLSRPAKLALTVAVDTIALPICFLIALGLRLGSFHVVNATSLIFAAMMTLVALAFFVRTGLYGAVIRFIELRVVLIIGMGLGVVVLAAYGIMLLFGQAGLPRTSLGIFWLVAFAYLTVSRFAARSLSRRISVGPARFRQRAMIYGAGEAGVQLAQAMQNSREYDAVCFVDDYQALWGKSVSGIRVISPDQITHRLDRDRISVIVVAIPSARPSRVTEIISTLECYGVPVRVLPGMTGLVDGQTAISAIRAVEPSDLLGRDQVPPRADLFARCISGKTVMVTGAGGSIGSELCRQIMTQTPQALVLFDHSEYNLYAIESELSLKFPATRLVTVLGSVKNESLLTHVMTTEKVQTVYHAAAYKHVPIVESNVLEGVANNVLGSYAVALAAGNAGVEACVLVSTDKAVRPTNIMGTTKRAAELVFQAATDHFADTCFSMVRFGNVLGSSGSVVPLFEKQISAGGPITLTHADITRYFMLIPEAAQLVIQAGAMAKGGEVFVLDMGEPVRIIDLARKMIRLSGYSECSSQNPDGDIEIKVVGLRPGEKLYEELLIGDNAEPSEHPKIMRAHERKLPWSEVVRSAAELRRACDTFDQDRAIAVLSTLVPEYREPEHHGAMRLSA
ncbi:polysaccharide biosynthesis protein [Cupriavidus plantarum]|uniref:polysaccharide biosynthesis protein n=1 Tax=Cupriavidus plantarum TaxID=942865 RepID=UPI000EB310B3|nr:nucleoside-diphosphate sugar epimerase/dehydratase [Cupriavidus plantarum]NYH98074.1 FlaA1/EpsC-like NDP-sugar epimerase [Cupriavidus plantarum]RLK35495.1 FlaA1/EpsC-like NDP-sugar epimerase [Cupriavidus plantarum]